MHKHLTRGIALIERVARIAFAFLILNSSAVAALGAVALRKKVWR